MRSGRIQPLQALVGRCEFSGLETSAIGRYPLYATTGVEGPVLTTKQFLE